MTASSYSVIRLRVPNPSRKGPSGTRCRSCVGQLRRGGRAWYGPTDRARPGHLIGVWAAVTAGMSGRDPINIGTPSAVCDIADDQCVAVDCRSALIADQLAAAGVPLQRFRHIPDVM